MGQWHELQRGGAVDGDDDWAVGGELGADEHVQGYFLSRTVAFAVRLGQLTRRTIPGVIDFEYTFPSTTNNGQIERVKDHITGEEVNYAYDALQRLVTAQTTGPDWGLSFGYDGFGNKLSQTVTKVSIEDSLLCTFAF